MYKYGELAPVGIDISPSIPTPIQQPFHLSTKKTYKSTTSVEMKTSIIAMSLLASLALAFPTDPTPDAADLEKRTCNRDTCCWADDCSWGQCLENFCGAFPDSGTCPGVCDRSCSSC
ncbi:unnamed protein product [Periconia digitata]|uniref:Uncharacterized protein n=1 Tax=Periconia digitata TaxID=1303443 RepID=A0A9W4UUS3_9PLEO|nr:unnamed protein product [Periconia digitata]